MNTSFKTLRDYSKARLDILKQLRDAGIEQEIDLPQIVAVGNQSVGKSSLMEAISTLKLPRGGGTVTKCPMEFRLKHSADSPSLSVDITLRFGNEHVQFRSNLSDLNEICRAIGDAQDHILNPSLLGRGTAATLGENVRTFSEDCVCVFAKGPNMHDLYFYDIPGVIHEVRDGQDPAQIDLINNLVKKYVAKPHCIVLLVVSCGYDIEIGGVSRLIFTDSNPELKERTVGVLTKADKVDEPAYYATWVATFNNKARNLDNGWFAVKLPAGGDTEWEVARKQERDFFENKEPWKSIRGEDRRRLGSEQLTQYISKQLSKLVADRLPAISQKMTELIDEWETKLERLPYHTEQDASVAIRTVIVDFDKDFSAHIEGIPPDPFTTNVSLVYQVKGLYDSIRQEVSRHTPRFCPMNIPDDGAFPGSSSAWGQLCAEGDIVYLNEIVEDLKQAVTRELPGELPYGITLRIITYHVKSWMNIAIEKFRSVKALAVNHFNALVQMHFAEYKRGGLLSSVKEILNENIDYCAKATTAQLKALAEMELVPSTVLKAEYVVLQSSIHEQYVSEWISDPAHETSLWSALAEIFGGFLANSSATVLAELGGGDISATTLETLVRQFATSGEHKNVANLNGPVADKDHRNALTVMSRAQAYLELASKRFAEVAANCIDHSFLRQLRDRVCKALRALPANTSPEICLNLVQDPTTVDTRRELTEKRNHYARVKDALDDARRDLEMDSPGLDTHDGSQNTAPDLRQQGTSGLGRGPSYSPLSVDYSSPSLTDIDVVDSE